MKDKDLSRFRSYVIEKTILLETLISVAITGKYFGSFNENFFLEVMCDEYFNSGLKLRILVKTFPNIINKKIEEKIRRIFNIRNLFAHNHSLKIYDNQKQKWMALNPKRFDRGVEKAKEKSDNNVGLDFKELFNEYSTLFKEIEPFLNNLISKYKN